MENLASYIAQLNGKPMGAIASDLGVSRPFLYDLIQEKRQPSLEVAMRIAKRSDGAVPVSSWPNLAKIHAEIAGQVAS